MGAVGSCGCGRKLNNEISDSWSTDFDLLDLSMDSLLQLYKLHNKYSNDLKQISHISLLEAVGIVQTESTLRIVSTHNNGGFFNFRQFVLIIWNFCSLNFDLLARFVFGLYDTESSGYLSRSIIIQIIKDCHDSKDSGSRKTIKRLTAEIETALLVDSRLDKSGFAKLCQFHYELLLPIFTAQTQVRRNTLGLIYWTEAIKKRASLCDGEYVSMLEYLTMLHKLKKHRSISSTINAAKKDYQDNMHVRGISVVSGNSSKKDNKMPQLSAKKSQNFGIKNKQHEYVNISERSLGDTVCSGEESKHNTVSTNRNSSNGNRYIAMLYSPTPATTTAHIVSKASPLQTKIVNVQPSKKEKPATSHDTFSLDLNAAPLRNKRLQQ